jgi:hypothetical protein
MKTSDWIRLIGILCIVFGILGIFNDILPYLITGLSEESGEIIQSSRDVSVWLTISKYSGIFVPLFYLLAGIFFLLKKPYSIWLMYIALSLSILNVLIPTIAARLFQSMIFALPGLIIDIALLILVFRIRKSYFGSPDEIVKVFGDNPAKPWLLKIFTFVGFICFSASLSILGLWIHAFNSAADQGDPVAIFKSYFPGFLQSGYNTSYFSLFLCFVAIVFCTLGLKSKGVLRMVNLIILVLSCLLLFLNLFQLM